MPTKRKIRGRRPRHIAIYQIKCLSNGKVYIGSSRDVCIRWNSHLWGLIGGAHSCKGLQEEFSKHGITYLSFSILTILNPYTDTKTIRKIEQGFMNKYPKDKLLNAKRAISKLNEG